MAFRVMLRPTYVFGEGSTKQIGDLLKGLGCKKVMCVFDKGVESAKLPDPILGYIKDAGIDIATYNGIEADPPDRVCEELAEKATEEKVDGFVAIGGGSTVDTVKAANLLVGNPGVPLANYHMNYGLGKDPGLPIITIPTTAGTGSELTPAAIITNTREGGERKVGQKMSIFESATAAKYALVDPLMTLNLPQKVAVATAMDALAHCIEAYTTPFANKFTDPLCVQGMNMIVEALPKILVTPSDIDARSDLALAASIGGFCAANAFAHIPHAIGQGLQGRFHMDHGTGCAIGLEAGIEAITNMLPEKVATIGEAFGVDVSGKSNEDAAAAVCEAITKFKKQVGLPTLKDLGIAKEDLESAVPFILTESAYKRVAALSDEWPSGEQILDYLNRVYGD